MVVYVIRSESQDGMETEPLQDTLPPRYAIESDDSEDEGEAILKRAAPKPDPNVVLNWFGPQSKPQPLVVALNEAGECWISGVELGTAKGRVLVDDIEVASASHPHWADLTIISVHARLTRYTMHSFASVVIRTLRPTSVIIIDSYSIPTYITSSHPLHPPIRCLRNSAASQNPPLTNVEPFHAPNLIQSPAASFLAILESRANSLPATLLLLPSIHIPPPAPSDIGRHSGPDVHEEWEPSMLVELHKLVNTLTGNDTPWSVKYSTDRFSPIKSSRRGDIGEGGMYI